MRSFALLLATCFRAAAFNLRSGPANLPAADPECLESRSSGLCTVHLASHTFHAPNPLVPPGIRGVYWIDAGASGKGFSNPWVDLNFLTPFPAGSSHEGKFLVPDATPRYQSWEDLPRSVSYVHMLKALGSRSVVAPDLTVTWSICGFTCGTPFETYVPLPLSSPSQKVAENEYIRKAVVFGITVATWKGYRIVDENGNRTTYFDEMLKKVNSTVLMMSE
eukprot:TRINITY_DN96407_c0_g1_i1.p1 TRINITY_DN96407_c0_g1~~TRINITY_DN96407_c0_g1_i1.p1  ORF type:complete len:220 (+),score=14.59 TRINITY_DN96407_c0_g1_i1:54-713(+)